VPPWLLALVIVAGVYAVVLLALVIAGRGVAARELAALLPNLILLFKDLAGDPRVSRGSKVLLVVGALWLVSPIDLIPEFLPIVGPLDDAVVAALILRHVAKRAGAPLLTELWRGDPRTLGRLLRAARVSP
jgi:uncharacterized membrane protein YkvA (DUF1232 family)